MITSTIPPADTAVGLYREVLTSNQVGYERNKMNKTIKIIAIILLVLGALAVVGGVGFSLVSRNLMGQGMTALNPQNLPQWRGGDRPMMEGFRGGRGFASFRLPVWLMGGGLTFLIAGVVLLIFNRRISTAVEPDVKVKSNRPARTAETAKEKASVTKKSSKKKAQ